MFTKQLVDEYASKTMAHSHNRHTDTGLSCRLWTKVDVLFSTLCGFFGRSHRILWHNCSPPASLRLTFLLFAVLYIRQILLVPVIILLWALVPMSLFMLAHSSSKRGSTEELGKAVLGPIYVTLPLALLVLIDLRPGGQASL